MCCGFAESTTMFGSLFGNGSSQSSFVFAPPEVAVHSASHPCGPRLTPFAVTVRFSPAPSPPAAPTLATATAAAPSKTTSVAANRNRMLSSSIALSIPEDDPTTLQPRRLGVRGRRVKA
jgi:hypothetical protein